MNESESCFDLIEFINERDYALYYYIYRSNFDILLQDGCITWLIAQCLV